MAWESRERGGLYYTRSVRRNGRVRREYVGTGALAEAIAALDGYDRQRRDDAEAQTRAAIGEFDELEAAVSEYDREVSSMVAAALTAAGYHRHDRSDWRRKRDHKMKPKTANEAPQELAILDTRAAKLAVISAGIHATEGSPAEAQAIECLRQIRKESDTPSYDTFSGPLLDMTISKDQTFARLIMKFDFDRDCANLAGPNATNLEKLLAERIVVCKNQLLSCETLYAKRFKEGLTAQVAIILEKRIGMAQKRYFAAIKALAQIRRLQLPPTIQVNIGEKQVNLICAGKAQSTSQLAPRSLSETPSQTP